MKPRFVLGRFRAALAAALSVIAAACAESATQPGVGIRVPNGGTSAEVTVPIIDGANTAFAQLGATTDRVNLTIPTQFHAQNPCAGGRFGEIVVFTGDQHLVFSQTTTANGHLSSMVHWNADQVIGVGQFTGFLYRATGVTQDHIVSNVPLPYTETSTNSYHIIGQGQATNMDLHETVHMTVDANGRVSAWVTDYNFACHGDPTF
jgi:hypothetical protein